MSKRFQTNTRRNWEEKEEARAHKLVFRQTSARGRCLEFLLYWITLQDAGWRRGAGAWGAPTTDKKQELRPRKKLALCNMQMLQALVHDRWCFVNRVSSTVYCFYA